MSIVLTPIITASEIEWNANTAPIVLDRVVYETDTGRYKIGDGVSTYAQLPYQTNLNPTNYMFMIGLADLTAIFSTSPSGSTGSSLTELWSPGTLTLSDWTPANIGGILTTTVTQDGTKSLTLVSEKQSTAGGSVTTEWGAYYTPVPTAPYKVLIGYNSLITANSVLSGSSMTNFVGNPMGVGWSDGTSAFWFTPINGSWNYSSPAGLFSAISGFSSTNIVGTHQFTDDSFSQSSPSDCFIILSDDGTNITISETNDGKTEHVLYTNAKSALTATGIPATVFNNLALIVGATKGAGNSSQYAGGSINNIFLYDPDVAN
ncbi:MAG: hypothetical protein KGK02_11500, partial [Rhodospirillales bacterium]|nr:hypothetical protein [Rhodospirillales bacterium]